MCENYHLEAGFKQSRKSAYNLVKKKSVISIVISAIELEESECFHFLLTLLITPLLTI